MITKDRYQDYDPRVKEYMNILIDNLVAEYGEAKDEWIMTLDMIAQNFEIYYIGYDSVKSEGIYTFDAKGNKQRNPGITLQLNSQAYIQKLINSMGWSLLAKSKLKTPDIQDSEDDIFND